MSESAYNSPLFTRRLTESCCSSPARSIGGHAPEVLTDSDGEGDLCFTETPCTPDQTVIAGWLKFRDNKKVRKKLLLLTDILCIENFDLDLSCCWCETFIAV